MSVKFFARFNLHNSICENPISVAHLRPFLDMSDKELDDMLTEIENIQKKRAEQLSGDYSSLYGKSVLFVGDSITSDNLGYRDTVTLAGRLLATDGAVSGGTSSTVLYSTKAHIEKSCPDIVSIMIGSNDSVCIDNLNLPQVSLAEYKRNVNAIVKWAKDSGAGVMLFEIPPVIEPRFKKSFDSQSKLQSNENINKYNSVLKEIADSFDIPLLPNGWLCGMEEFYMPDGIHLSADGQTQFAKKWLDAALQL